MIELTRKQILKGSYIYPKEPFSIKPTKHFLQRLEEREVGLMCIPWTVQVTPENIYSGKSNDGINLTSVVIKIKFSNWEDLYYVINPFDHGGKSLWFRKKTSKPKCSQVSCR